MESRTDFLKKIYCNPSTTYTQYIANIVRAAGFYIDSETPHNLLENIDRLHNTVLRLERQSTLHAIIADSDGLDAVGDSSIEFLQSVFDDSPFRSDISSPLIFIRQKAEEQGDWPPSEDK